MMMMMTISNWFKRFIGSDVSFEIKPGCVDQHLSVLMVPNFWLMKIRSSTTHEMIKRNKEVQEKFSMLHLYKLSIHTETLESVPLNSQLIKK